MLLQCPGICGTACPYRPAFTKARGDFQAIPVVLTKQHPDITAAGFRTRSPRNTWSRKEGHATLRNAFRPTDGLPCKRRSHPGSNGKGLRLNQGYRSNRHGPSRWDQLGAVQHTAGGVIDVNIDPIFTFATRMPARAPDIRSPGARGQKRRGANVSAPLLIAFIGLRL